MKKSVLIVMSLFFLAIGLFVVFENYHKPRILILHSYCNKYVWVKDINQGIKRELSKNNWFTAQYHYMHTDLFYEEDDLHRASVAARQAIKQFRPDILLAIDDSAQELVGKYYVNDPKMKIVFAGINGEVTPYGYDKANNVTGIMEHKQFHPMKEMLAHLGQHLGHPPRFAHLSDHSMASITDTAEAEKITWDPLVYLGGFTVADFEEWKKKALELNGKIDFLLVSGYRQLAFGKGNADFVPPEEIMAWTLKNVEVPVIGLNVFNSRDGAMISLGVSPYEQGEVATHMALELLAGKQISDLPIRPAKMYVISMSKRTLKRYGVTPPLILEAFARASNNYFE